MALYTFYPCKADGLSDTFVCMDLGYDGEACIRAQDVFDAHQSCVEVVIYQGERRVMSLQRAHAALRCSPG